MEFEVLVGSKSFEATVESPESISIGSRQLTVLLASNGLFELEATSGARLIGWGAHEMDDRYLVYVDGFAVPVQLNRRSVVSAQDALHIREKRLSYGPKPVLSPMPGLIRRLLVSQGDEVRPGDTLLILEAMKMENEVKTTTGGKVSHISVAAGDNVEKGRVLVELSPV